ncbi:MAG TPA: PEP-CTERM sorting domain-containing protein [Terriglobales bacterium]|jgi:hypothetical protein|nr:PEP-CTERM sorting domain-containing protein [Terriglobales bacterium]
MKISQVFAVLLLLAMGSMMAFADGINDPRIVIHGVAGGNALVTCPNCVGVGTDFSFSVPKSGSGTLFFTNESGQNWTSLTLVEKGEPAADISCQSYLFESCTTKTLKNGAVEILLSGVKSGALNADKGIPNGTSFSITFSCINKSCWPGGLVFNGHANAAAGSVPEPGTIALMVTGFGAMFSRRKLWKNRWNS